MRRYFNTEGWCSSERHYMVRLDERLDKIKRLYVDTMEYSNEYIFTKAFLRMFVETLEDCEAISRKGESLYGKILECWKCRVYGGQKGTLCR